ncbi:DUF2846 domain-containing protein [Chitinimonas arctica]|uniref:DUF2846 domain-containing protein n=1 Tax=Chitinimonas arctica TaxID=2594795 RepID=A0A516SD05_9NEIS|nr:DUF2846 domain-containing protein [Chitinimonas arctica]QDQ26035.1 DUF2846 domain-containing protein [Chitinimonas arctica]
MKKLYFSALALIALLSTAAIAAPKMSAVRDQIQPVAADKGRIYFYRDSSFFGMGVQPEIRLNGETIGQSSSGTAFFVDRAPGQYEASAKDDAGSNRPFAVEAGKVIYFKTKISMGLLSGHFSFNEMPAEQATLEMSNLNYSGRQDLLATPGSVPVAAPAAAPAAHEAPASAAVTTTTLDAAAAPAAAPNLSMDSSIQSDKDLKLGTWSYDAEKLAQKHGCVSNGSGAWVIGKQQGVNETYRIRCADGSKFLVVCDSGECRPI